MARVQIESVLLGLGVLHRHRAEVQQKHGPQVGGAAFTPIGVEFLPLRVAVDLFLAHRRQTVALSLFRGDLRRQSYIRVYLPVCDDSGCTGGYDLCLFVSGRTDRSGRVL